MEFSLITDEKYYRFLSKNHNHCGFASAYGGVHLNLPKINRAMTRLAKKQLPGLEQTLRFDELDDVQKKKLTSLIIDPFTDDIYLTRIVGVLNHEAFHVLLYGQKEFYNEKYMKKGFRRTHHALIKQLEEDDFYTFRFGKIAEPVNLGIYVEDLIK